MSFALELTREANEQYLALGKSGHLSIQFKAVKKALQLLEQNPRHPGLHTHEYDSIEGPVGVKVFEAYAQNKTPRAYRIFWCYYPPKANTITVIAIRPHA